MGRGVRIFGVEWWVILAAGLPLLAAFGLAIGFTAWWGPSIRLFWALDRMSTTQGVVERADVSVTRSSGGGGSVFVPWVRYTYTVEGKMYTSERLRAFERRLLDEPEAQSAIDPFPVGSAVTVHYHPGAPGLAVLDTTPQWGKFMMFVGLLGLIWAVPVLIPGIAGWIFLSDALAARRRKREGQGR